MKFLSTLVSAFVFAASLVVTPTPLVAGGAEQILTLLAVGGLSVYAQNQQGRWFVRAVRAQYEGERQIVEEENRSEVEATRILAPAQRVAIVLSAKDKRDITTALVEAVKTGKVTGEQLIEALHSPLLAMDAGSVQTGGLTIGQFSNYGGGGYSGYSHGYYPRASQGAYRDAAASARYWADIRRQQAEWGHSQELSRQRDAAASARYWADIRRQQAEWGR